MLCGRAKQAPHGDAAAARASCCCCRRLVLGLRVRGSGRRVYDVLGAFAVDLRQRMIVATLLLPLPPTFVSMLVPPFSLTSSSWAFCITARNYEN